MEAGKYRAFQGRFSTDAWTRDPNQGQSSWQSAEPQVAGLPWAFAGKTYMPCGRASDQIEIFCAYIPIYRKYLYILSYPVFLYYAESTKVPPRVFGASDQIEIFCAYIPIYRKYLYILSYPVFLYYAESTKVPPRVFGPLGPKTLRGQLVIVITKAAPAFFYFCWLKTIILSVIVWNRILYFL